MSTYKCGSAGPGAVHVPATLPLYGQNKAGSAIDANNGRRVVAFDIAVGDAVVADATNQNAVLWTLPTNSLLEGVAVRNIGNSDLASGAALKIDAGGVDMTGDIQSLAAGATDVLTFRLPTNAASCLVDGANGFKCAATESTTIRVLLFLVDVDDAFSNA